jgi:hypothetical protein
MLHHSTTKNIRGESYRLKERRRAGLVPARDGFQLLGLGLRCAQNAPKDGAGLHCVQGQGGSFTRCLGGEFPTGEMGNFHPALTAVARVRLLPSRVPPTVVLNECFST